MLNSYLHIGLNSHMTSHLFILFDFYNKPSGQVLSTPHFSSRLEREMVCQRAFGKDSPGF